MPNYKVTLDAAQTSDISLKYNSTVEARMGWADHFRGHHLVEQEQRMARLKVSMDEWVVINYTQVDLGFCLWTDGLSGCVGVAIAAGPRAFMTHISSGLKEANKADYMNKLSKALKALGPAAAVSQVKVVLGGHSSQEVQRGYWVADQVLNSLKINNDDIFDGEPVEPFSGVVARVAGPAGKAWGLATQTNLGVPGGSTTPFLNSETGSYLFEAFGTFEEFDGPAKP